MTCIQHVMPLLHWPEADNVMQYTCVNISVAQVGVVLNWQEQQVKNRKPHVCCNISHTASPAHPQINVKTHSHHIP